MVLIYFVVWLSVVVFVYVLGLTVQWIMNGAPVLPIDDEPRPEVTRAENGNT